MIIAKTTYNFILLDFYSLLQDKTRATDVISLYAQLPYLYRSGKSGIANLVLPDFVIDVIEIMTKYLHYIGPNAISPKIS